MRGIKDLRNRVFHLLRHVCTMWESCGLVLIDESRRGGKHHFFDVFCARVVIPPFPNPGVRLIKEDEHVAIWEEVFEPGKPTSPHRHMRDYIAIFPHAGELTIIPLAGEAEEYTIIAGHTEAMPTEKGGTRVVFSDGTMIHSRVPADGTGHFAVNEGQHAALMILIEIKGSATEKRVK